MIRYLTKEELVMINVILIKKYSPSEQIKVVSPELLDSAINRPKQSAFGKDMYESIFEKGAALFESLAQNHAFISANKRVAFVGLVQFLKYNGYNLTMTQEEAESFTLDIVMHNCDFKGIVLEIKKNTKRI
mgnify:CR=1 FL=1